MKRILFILLLTIPIITMAQKNNCKCCDENYKAFDFWIGEWNTYTPDGKLAGTNSIQKTQGNCVLVENWISARAGYTGTSYNFYNGNENRWEQIWIDNQGQSLHLKGNRQGDKMILVSDKMKGQQGNTIYNRIIWTKNEDGTVRQQWETSSDKQNWKTVFDGLYKQKR